MERVWREVFPVERRKVRGSPAQAQEAGVSVRESPVAEKNYAEVKEVPEDK